MIQGASREAAAAAVAELDRALDDEGDASGRIGAELFAVTRLLDREVALRRTLSDPSRSGDSRAQMLDALLADQVSDPTRAVVAEAVRQRWSRPSDLVGTLEDLSVRAVVASASAGGDLDNLEDELFRFRRIVQANAELRNALSDQGIDPQRRAELLESLLGGRVSAPTRTLIDQAVVDRGARSLEHTLERYSGVVAAHRRRLVAHVRTVTELTAEQHTRLSAALAKMYGREVALNVAVDPSVIGGISVQLGDEVVDATILSRLDEARRRLAG